MEAGDADGRPARRRAAGRSSRQRAMARGQRAAKAQPGGRSKGDGISPLSAASVAALAGIRAEVAVQQRARVGVARPGLGVGQFLDHRAQIHHHDPVAEIAHQAEIMADEQVGQAQLAPADPPAAR